MASLSIPSVPLTFPWGTKVPSTGELMSLAEGVFWLRFPLPFALDHINVWLLADEEGWVVVDTGYACALNQATWSQVLAATGRPVHRIIVTHYHPDHLGLAHWLCTQFPQAKVWMSEAEYLTAHMVYHGVGAFEAEALVGLFTQHGLLDERQQMLRERGNAYPRGVDGLPTTIQRLRAGDVLSINKVEWEVKVHHGHSPEHLSLFSPQHQLFIAGDMLLPKISTNVSVWPAFPDGDPLGDFLAALALMQDDLPAETLVLPSHGLPFRGVATRITQLQQHHEQRLAELCTACEKPRHATELLTVLFQRPLDIHQLFFALGEAVAHLNYLMHRGKLCRHLGEDGIYRFVQCGT